MERHEEIDRLKTRLQWEERRAATRISPVRRWTRLPRVAALVFWVGRWRRSGRSSACCWRFQLGFAAGDGGRAVRSINLLRLAFDAELLRLRAMMARQGRRAAFAVIALIFDCLVVLALAEAPAGGPAAPQVESLPATLILLGVNLVIAAIFGVLAARSSPGHTEQEALRVRGRPWTRRGARWPSPRPCLPSRLSWGGRGRAAAAWRSPLAISPENLAALRAGRSKGRSGGLAPPAGTAAAAVAATLFLIAGKRRRHDRLSASPRSA